MLPPDVSLQQALDAHADFLARGARGEGRLVLRRAARDVVFRGCDLREARFEGASLEGASFESAYLEGARFAECSLEHADLRRADLTDTSFESCDLRRAFVAGAKVRRTGFLGCAMGDFASQTIGRPEVLGPYVVNAPDLSNRGDGSSIGTPADIDQRWYRKPPDDEKRVYEFGADGPRRGARILHLHIVFFEERGLRWDERTVPMTFARFLEEGPPPGFAPSMTDATRDALVETVSRVAERWAPAAK